MFADDTLLDDLAVAFEPAEALPSEPSAAELDALAMAVADHFGMASLTAGSAGHDLAMLEAALAPDGLLPAEPTNDELSRLGCAVSAVFGSEQGDRAPVGGVLISLNDARVRLGSRIRRRMIGGTGIFVAAGVLTAGAAAAATAAHVPFTRPIAQIAHDLGLMHSPAYDDAQAKADQLSDDVKEHDVPAVEVDLADLRQDERNLDPGERSQVVADSSPAVSQAETVIDSNPGTVPPVGQTPPTDDTTTTTVPDDSTTTVPNDTTTTVPNDTTTTVPADSTTTAP